ncbi:unnamed protein product [Cylindrotheca closterium]|uniref:Uncharacterized protein n=1 Tax=Cylindrotheca closterium TaxID=2856 RepID=A0AAD2PVA0_9STRA|nr:unnamed protein product [Cylindrotheca closterium]
MINDFYFDRMNKVNASDFYAEYHGHKVQHLKVVYSCLRKETEQGLIWTAGDSSLDNKYWFRDSRPAVGAYRDALEPAISNADVTYWLNYHGINERRNQKYAAINTAIEATTLNSRAFRLKAQDKFLRDNIQQDDVLIVSVGGNDIALAPTPCTIMSLLCLPHMCMPYSKVFGSIPMDDKCCGCGCSLLSCGCAFPPCLGYLVHLFGTRVQKYIERLISKTRPKKILVCMIYYLDENPSPSWAGPALGALGYNSHPERIQLLIRKIFMEATSSIQIPGSEVIPVPLFNALNGKDHSDYIARVEPSSKGGEKMAEYLLDMIDNGPSPSQSVLVSTTQMMPVESSYIADRT